MAVFLVDLDTGPETCIFEQVAKSKPPAASRVDHFLGFAKQLRYRASEVLELINRYKEEASSLHEKIHKQLITYSVARWIFYTNQIEFAGAATEGDTEALITGHVRAKGTVMDREVLQTFELLKHSYSGETSITTKIFDVPKLQEWHSVLFTLLLEKPGAFRKSGVMTTNLDGSDHVYPHHSIVSWTTSALCHVVYQLAKDIEQHYTDPMERVLYTFALAAFAQYHFADIHPFVDGNGRMCRFLSKVLLDSCCPLPFPMFENRDTYLGALIDGRRQHNPAATPLPLANLLLESASTFYRVIIGRYFIDRPFTKLLVADNEQALRHMCEEEQVDNAVIDRLVVEFNQLSPNQTKDIVVGHEKYHVKHYVDIGAVVDAL